MTESRIVFHCGLPKTGTSSIQSFFAAKQGLLKGTLAYPGDNSPAGNADWMVPLIMRNNLPRIKAIAREAQKESSVVLFSSENLYHAIRIAPKPFIQLINALKATVIIYVPTIRAFLLSSLNQLIRNHCHATTEVDERLMEMCNYTNSLIQLHEALGPERFCCYPYDRKGFPGGNILLHLLGILGIESKEIIEQATSYRDKNVSLTPLALGLLYEMARGGMTLQTPEIQNQIRRLVQGYSSTCTTQVPITPFTISAPYQDLILRSEASFSSVFSFEVKSDFDQLNTGVCTPVGEEHWDGLLREINPQDTTLSTAIQTLRLNAKLHLNHPGTETDSSLDVDSKSAQKTPIGFSTSEQDLFQRAYLKQLWEAERGLKLTDNGKLLLPQSTEPVIIDLPQIFPISSLFLSVTVLFQEKPGHAPWLYWTDVSTPTLVKKNSCPMKELAKNKFRAEVTDPLYNGSLSIWIQDCVENVCIESIVISFASEHEPE
jgi:hypothetical protein